MNKPSDPDCYWVEPGRLLAGEYPGSFHADSARTKLQALLDAGIRTFIDLTETDDPLEPYRPWLEDEARALGVAVSYHRLPIRDMSVPDREGMRRILQTIGSALAAGSPAYVHCWGGVGRTGTVVGCWLVERGVAAGEAVDTIRRLRATCAERGRRSPETDEQRAFVEEWPDGGRS